MEGSDEIPQKSKWTKLIRKFLFRKTAQSAPEATPVIDQAAIDRTFESVQKMLNAQNTDSEGVRRVQVTPEGGIDALASVELTASQPHLELSKAEVGDVVWWRTTDGHQGYFLITDPYQEGERGGDDFKYGEGYLKVSSDQGSLNNEKGTIEGAGFGMLWMGRIAKNTPIQIVVPEGDHQGRYMTQPVESFGIIKAEQIGNK